MLAAKYSRQNILGQNENWNEDTLGESESIGQNRKNSIYIYIFL